MTKNNVFVGKGYCNQGLFVLKISNVINKNTSSSAYLIDFIDLWHARLGYVNVSYINKMQSLGIISGFSNSKFDKCPICAETKINKKTCHSVTRETDLLNLIHFDLGDLK